MKKTIYFFEQGKSDGSAKMKDILGGKGANLAEMANLNLPVPPGFTISTEVCIKYLRQPSALDAIDEDVSEAIERLERIMKRKFGGAKNPLLVSVRSGSKFSMPGMMDTILNIGLNDETLEGLAEMSDNRAFALDCYRRLVEKYGEIVGNIPYARFDKILSDVKKEKNAESDAMLAEEDLARVVSEYKKIYQEATKENFPQDVSEQLKSAVASVFKSWNTPRAVAYRKMNKISHSLGTAVTVQAMVFGNLGKTSATGVAFTRNPATGENVFYGEYLPNAQGEDVVAGIRTPLPINRSMATEGGENLEDAMPKLYKELEGIRGKLEKHYKDMLDLEWTIESGKLFILQARVGKRTGVAALRMAAEMADEKLITPQTAVMRVEPAHLEQALAPTFDAKEKAEVLAKGKLLAVGLNAGPGAASGRVALSPEKAIDMVQNKGEKVILVRIETSPEDVAGMSAARGILTARGGMTSHAAVVARGMGKACVVGCKDLQIDYLTKQIRIKDTVVKQGDYISIDGSTGEVISGEIATRPSEVLRVLTEKTLSPDEAPLYRLYERFIGWVKDFQGMGVRANADTPEDAKVARAFGATGIGLARTEHMFFKEDRIPLMREMILARTEEERQNALAKLLPLQRADFTEILRAMDGYPVTIRLLDPPLHEFIPRERATLEDLARRMNITYEEVKVKADSLAEANPMLGHRGCRLAITYPEIYEMQARAIFEAVSVLKKDGFNVIPEIMVPLVSDVGELNFIRPKIDAIANEIIAKTGISFSWTVGTMIEIPRAALRADEIARATDFFSFGTNDLTQMTYGFSRDDAGAFLPEYISKGILQSDPFQTLDVEGVGELVITATKRGRQANPSLKVGICGEHGGEPSSVKFFCSAGLDYVSCSPYRVPIARLTSAQSAIEKELKTEDGDTR